MDIAKLQCKIKESEEWIQLMEKNFNNFARKEQFHLKIDIDTEKEKVKRLKSTLKRVI
jgi:hypothetical protein